MDAESISFLHRSYFYSKGEQLILAEIGVIDHFQNWFKRKEEQELQEQVLDYFNHEKNIEQKKRRKPAPAIYQLYTGATLCTVLRRREEHLRQTFLETITCKVRQKEQYEFLRFSRSPLRLLVFVARHEQNPVHLGAKLLQAVNRSSSSSQPLLSAYFKSPRTPSAEATLSATGAPGVSAAAALNALVSRGSVFRSKKILRHRRKRPLAASSDDSIVSFLDKFKHEPKRAAAQNPSMEIAHDQSNYVKTVQTSGFNDYASTAIALPSVRKVMNRPGPVQTVSCEKDQDVSLEATLANDEDLKSHLSVADSSHSLHNNESSSLVQDSNSVALTREDTPARTEHDHDPTLPPRPDCDQGPIPRSNSPPEGDRKSPPLRVDYAPRRSARLPSLSPCLALPSRLKRRRLKKS